MKKENVRKKRPQGAPPRKERRDGVKSGTRSSSSGSAVKKSAPGNTSRGSGPLHTLGIDLNAKTARQAVILSEIIGKPVSKRGRRR